MRLTSLDVFRGIAITSMILVNNPGSWNHVYRLLKHAEWHGYTPTDLIFPGFLFIVGVAMAFSLAKYLSKNRNDEDNITSKIYLKILRRCAILFLLGLLLNGYPNYDLANIRIMGVLQRISLAYGLSAIAILHRSRKQIAGLCVIILLGYAIAMQLIPVPGYGVGNLTPEGNLAAYFDRLILGENHLLGGGKYDPEGLLSTLPAIVTVLIGYLTGDWLKKQSVKSRTSINLAIIGLCNIIIGHFWGVIFPINKPLWTSSFVLVTAGWALILLAICYELIEVRRRRKWGFPLEVMGLNPIFLFVASGFVARILIYTKIPQNGELISLKTWIYENMFVSWAGEMNGSLAFAIANVLIWWIVLYGMYQKRWFLKV
ncbi:MAG: heparan-alpha-glucosaminide N-acetyltransferase domain-containing protein [Lyngbya sp.]|nr:heparan-alpha-glucosaminide N-acetyltransferase domain-containing protein [Lyngbya sp.]